MLRASQLQMRSAALAARRAASRSPSAVAAGASSVARLSTRSRSAAPSTRQLSLKPASYLQSSQWQRSISLFHSSAPTWAETIKVPQMAESISEGTLKTWLKKPGDFVKADEEIASIETDKIDVAINAPKAGKIVEVFAKEEDTVTVGQDLYTLEPGEEGEQSSGQSEEQASEPEQESKQEEPKQESKQESKSEESTPAPQGEAETIKVPQMAESISEGTLKTWNKKVGDYVEADEEIASIETDKIDVTINAPKAGTITEIYVNEEETATVGQDLYKLVPGGKSDSASKSSSDSATGTGQEPPDDAKSKTATVSQEDQGPNKGRKPSSYRSDVANKEKEPSRPEPKASKPSEMNQPKPQAKKEDTSSAQGQSSKPTPGNRTERRVKMNSMRRRIAERLKQSQNAAASLTTFNEIDMSSLMQMRTQYKDQILKNHGIKFGFMSAFAKASALALMEIPAANASIEGPGPGEQMVFRDYVDLSVAVATPKGLVTPIVRNVESMSMLEIEKAIADLGKKARDNKLTLEDMTGGTFTISNGGVFGSLYGTPIINLPQSAVLGMHSIKDRATVVDGKIEIRPIMVVALTYDHRILDGREAVTFLVRIKQYIEDPRFMLLA